MAGFGTLSRSLHLRPASRSSGIAVRRDLWREVAWAGALVLAVQLPFLVSPAPQRGTEMQHGVRTIYLAGPVHVNVDIDSPQFVAVSHDPRLLLTEEGHTWQSRPLYLALGWSLALPFRAAGLGVLGDRMFAGRPLPGIPGSYGSYLPEFAGLVLLNWLLVTAALVLLRRLLGERSLRSPAVILPAALLLANEVTKPGFWTPHLQMFNLAVPVGTLALLAWMHARRDRLHAGHAWEIGTGLGVGALAYGAFAIPAGAAALAMVLTRTPARLWTRCLRAALLLAAFFIPLVVWVMFVRARTGTFYSHEVARYHQFVWIFETARRGMGVLGVTLAQNLSSYLTTLVMVAWCPLLALAAAWAAVYATGAARPWSDRERSVLRASATYLAVCVPFFALAGYYATRLTWTVVPAMLPALGFAIARLERAPRPAVRWWAMGAVAAAALGWWIFWVARTGPWYATPLTPLW